MARTKTAKRSTINSQVIAEGISNWAGNVFKAQSREFYQLLGVVLFLSAFGVLMVLSSSFVDALKSNNNAFSIFGKQAFSAIVGFLGLAFISTLPSTAIRRLLGPFGLVVLVTQLLVVFTPLGTEVNGNKNWITILGFTVQPSEFLKICLIIILAQFLASRQHEFDDPRRVWWPAIVVGGAIAFTVLLGKDVGTVIVMAIITIGMLIAAGMPRPIISAVSVLAAIAIPAIMISSPSRMGRVLAWLNPNAPDPNDFNWQSTHGVWAFAAGGFTGVGLGQSKLKWSWIPEAENDFIFAIIGEEMGLIGALLVIAVFFALALVLIRIAMRTHDLYSRMVVLGVMFWIVMQAVINLSVVLTLLPVLGVPLPLISAGGSSMVANLMALGLVFGIERENHRLGPVPARKRRR
jgi:cell division protein FtsW